MSIIKISNDLTVSSREVAEKFGKEHKNILQSIENLAAENSAVTVPQFAKKENMGENAVRRRLRL
ncbi:MAG: hypothetical protein PWQ06_127 [Anaerophaga sp.]|nr:hypothetical protein [Anaerophaga sp.]